MDNFNSRPYPVWNEIRQKRRLIKPCSDDVFSPRKFSMLADSEESVESDEEFYFVDDNKNPSPKKSKAASSSVKPLSQRMKVTVKGPEEPKLDSEMTESSPNGNSQEFSITKPGDFARMMATFDGFNQDGDGKNDRKSVRSYKNRLFEATQVDGSEKGKRSDMAEVPKCDNPNNTPGASALPGIADSESKPDIPAKSWKETNDNKNDTTASSVPSMDSGTNDASDSKSVTNQKADTGTSADSAQNSGSTGNKTSADALTVSSDINANDMNKRSEPTDKQNSDERIPAEEMKDIAASASQTSENMNQKASSTNTQTDLKPLKGNNKNASSPRRNTPEVNTRPEANLELKGSNEDSPNSSTSLKPLAKSQETYLTVLPGTMEQSEGNSATNSKNSTLEGESESDSNNLFNKTGRSRAKCLSYLVVSGGEGHVDLRLRVKSKQDLKKDGQSMFLIWRVNSKM